MRDFKECINDIIQKGFMLAYEVDLEIIKVKVDFCQEWVSFTATAGHGIDFRYNISRYNLVYFDDEIYTEKEFIDRLEERRPEDWCKW